MSNLKCVQPDCVGQAQYIDSGFSYCESHYRTGQAQPDTLSAWWVYVAGIVVWALLWVPLLGCVGPNWLAERISEVYAENRGLLAIPICMGLFVLLVNLYLWRGKRGFASYDTEVKIIEFVERNAGWFLIASGTFLTSAAFLLTRPPGAPMAVPRLARQGIAVVLSFETASLLCLLLVVSLYWTPPPSRKLALLRHLKTIPFTYAVSFFAAAFITLVRAAMS